MDGRKNTPLSMPDPGHASLGVSWVGHLRATPLAVLLFHFRFSLGALGVQSSTAHPGPGS